MSRRVIAIFTPTSTNDSITPLNSEVIESEFQANLVNHTLHYIIDFFAGKTHVIYDSQEELLALGDEHSFR